ncbi:hypothetical protein ACLOJK_023461 [Asimina triloba]
MSYIQVMLDEAPGASGMGILMFNGGKVAVSKDLLVSPSNTLAMLGGEFDAKVVSRQRGLKAIEDYPTEDGIAVSKLDREGDESLNWGRAPQDIGRAAGIDKYSADRDVVKQGRNDERIVMGVLDTSSIIICEGERDTLFKIFVGRTVKAENLPLVVTLLGHGPTPLCHSVDGVNYLEWLGVEILGWRPSEVWKDVGVWTARCRYQGLPPRQNGDVFVEVALSDFFLDGVSKLPAVFGGMTKFFVEVANCLGSGGRWLDPGAAMVSGIIEDSFRVGALVESRDVGRQGVSLLVSYRQTARVDDPTRPAT